ncbi:MAG: sulfatase [Opitutaceae bacterium]
MILLTIARLRPLAALFLTGSLLGGLSAADQPPRRPNILFLAIDDLRPELGFYGDSQVKSPNIDRVAAQGVLFNRAYCQVAVCGASRASLMTSILPTANRFTIARTRADEDAPGAATMPQMFKAAGYTTLSNGKIFHFGADTDARSWSEPSWHPKASHATSHDPATTAQRSKDNRSRIYESPDVPDNAYGDGMVAEKTIEDLRRLKADGKPFFLACGFIRPHLPFYAPKKYWDLYDRAKLTLADNRYRPENAPAGLKGSNEYKSYEPGGYVDGTDEWHRMMRHGYYASVSYADKLVGDVLAELDRLGLAENTIVVIWGDHGWHLGEHDFWGKHNTLKNALRIPLIMKVPGLAAGHRTEGLVASLDIFPTLCALAGVATPDTIQGRSFAALLKQPEQKFRDEVYSRYGKGDAVVTENMIYTSYGADGEMLYDHRTDPNENHNLAGQSASAATVADMRRRLAAQQLLASQAKIGPPVRAGKRIPD